MTDDVVFLKAAPGVRTITLTWTNPVALDGIRIQRSNQTYPTSITDGTTVLASAVPVGRYVDVSLVTGKTYFYTVYAVLAGVYSAGVQIMTIVAPPKETGIVWSDMHPELKIGATGDPKLLTNVEAVYGSLDNIFRTVIGERVMLRRFAINFMSMLFEAINESLLKAQFVNEMKDQIMQWEPRVKIEYLDITANRDRSIIYVRVEMYIRGYEQAFTFEKEYAI